VKNIYKKTIVDRHGVLKKHYPNLLLDEIGMCKIIIKLSLKTI